ncbi:MAG: hypothetical protein PUB54_02065 [Lachnospiraceae bacterium]|nr:hypothetical protein [Lachnospiraceae bacterium]
MKFEITERDKKLLVMLSIFVIVVCIGYWGIYPVMKEKKKLGKEIENEKELQAANENMLSWLPALEKDNQELEEKIVDVRKKYYPYMTNSEIDKHFTALALDYNLYSYDLIIDSVSKIAELGPYQYSVQIEDTYFEEVQDDVTETVEDQDTDEEGDLEDTFLAFEDEQSSNIGIYSNNVTLKLGGDEKDLLRLIDDLSAESKLRVVSFQWEENSDIVLDDENDDYEMVTKKILTLSLEIYMYEE